MADLTTMRLLDHLEELRFRLKWSFLTVMVFFVLFAGFQLRTADVGGTSIPYPFPDPFRPFASQFFNATLNYLKPPFVVATVLNPVEAIIVQFKTAFFLGIIAAMPMIAYQMGKFIGPALHEHEKRLVMRLVAPSILLFVAGVLVAFFAILPFTFAFLYEIARNIGVEQPFLRIDEFLDFVLLFMIGFGLAFQVPVVMYGLTAAGLVRAATWKKYWRFAIIGIFVFGVLITPDGSGVTMLLVSVPMSALYVVGYAASLLHERNRGHGQA